MFGCLVRDGRKKSWCWASFQNADVISEMKDLEIKPYESSYWEQAASLFASSFGHSWSLEHWQWKYGGNPWGTGRIMTAWEKGRMVGYYGAYPVEILDGEHSIKALHIGDVMTAPDARKKRVGKRSVIARLATAFYKVMCHDVAFNYGCPSSKHMRLGRLLLDYHDLGPVEAWSCPLEALEQADNRRSLLSLFGISKKCSKDDVEEVDGPGPDWEKLFNQVHGKYGMLIRRDLAYLRWRYSLIPNKKYRFFRVRKRGDTLLWAVLEKQEENLALGDFMLDPAHPDCLFALFSYIRASWSEEKAFSLWGGDSPSWLTAFYKKAGLKKEKHPLNIQLAATIFDESNYPPELIQAKRYYSMADFDLF